jgi:hypothetical protein
MDSKLDGSAVACASAVSVSYRESKYEQEDDWSNEDPATRAN